MTLPASPRAPSNGSDVVKRAVGGIRLGAAVVAVAFASVLGACSTDVAPENLESDLVGQIESGGETVSLPTGGFEATWTRASIVCPYETAEGATPEVQEVFAKQGDLFSASDDSQWIVFSDGKDVSVRKVSRARIDFCNIDSQARTVTPADEFRVTDGTGESGDPWILTR